LYTDLPKVTPVANLLKQELIAAQAIKVKMLRSGIFSMEDLLQFPVAFPLQLNSVDVGVDRLVSLSFSKAIADNDARVVISLAFTEFLRQRMARLASVLSVQETSFIMNRIPLLFSIESLPGGCYVVRV